MKKLLLLIILIAGTANAQWYEYDRPSHYPISRIQFFDEQTGVYITNNSEFYKTVNGGQTWEKIYSSGMNGYITNFFMLDSLNGWGCSPRNIYKTEDGCRSWSSISTRNDELSTRNILFLDNLTGFIVTTDLHNQNIMVLKTTDGGYSWTTKYEGTGSNPIFEFPDKNIGYIKTGNKLLKTEDYGETWFKLDSFPSESTIKSASGYGADRLLVLAGRDIFSSTDGGSTFIKSYTFNSFHEQVKLVNDTTAFIVGRGIFKTTDFGQTWAKQSIFEFKNIFMLNENYGWAGGFTFAKTTTGGGRYNYFSIDFPAENDTIYALTELNLTFNSPQYSRINVKYSIDNGESWFDIVNNYPSDISYYWRVPNTPSNECKILIEDVSEPGKYNYEPSGNFTIAPPPPLLLLNPNRRLKTLYGTNNYAIEWYSEGVDSIRIEFSSDDGNKWSTVEETYPADSGRYIWKLPVIANSLDCRVKIVDTQNPAVNDMSDWNFEIRTPFNEITTIFGSVPRPGEVRNIELVGYYVGSLKLEFTEDGGKNYYLLDSLNSSGWGQEFWTWLKWSKYYTWTVPDISSDSCWFKLTAYESDLVSNTSAVFKIRNNVLIQTMIHEAEEGDSIFLREPEYYECFEITKPIKIIGLSNRATKIIGDSLATVIKINAENVALTNLSIIAKNKTIYTPGICGDYFPTDAITIINSNNIILDNIYIAGSKDVSVNFNISGGRALLINDSEYIKIINSDMIGADARILGSYRCGINGGEGLIIANSSFMTIDDCTILGGRGGDGDSRGAVPANGGYGGDALKLINSSQTEISNSVFIGGIGGRETGYSPSPIPGLFQAKAGDGVYCSGSEAIFNNSTLEGGEARFQLNSPNVPNTAGGNGITAVNNSDIIFDGGSLVAGMSTSESMGKMFFVDSSSTIKFFNVDPGIFPISYLLKQNYPNPFNPSTTIEYSVPEQANVSLKVFDILGREVATLVKEEKETGYYKVEFNGSSLPSGIYIFSMKAGKFTDSRKMVLLR